MGMDGVERGKNLDGRIKGLNGRLGIRVHDGC